MSNKKHGRCPGYELPAKPLRLVINGRLYCGHKDCQVNNYLFYFLYMVPSSEETSFWPPSMYIFSHHYMAEYLDLDYSLFTFGPLGRSYGHTKSVLRFLFIQSSGFGLMYPTVWMLTLNMPFDILKSKPKPSLKLHQRFATTFKINRALFPLTR